MRTIQIISEDDKLGEHFPNSASPCGNNCILSFIDILF